MHLNTSGLSSLPLYHRYLHSEVVTFAVCGKGYKDIFLAYNADEVIKVIESSITYVAYNSFISYVLLLSTKTTIQVQHIFCWRKHMENMYLGQRHWCAWFCNLFSTNEIARNCYDNNVVLLRLQFFRHYNNAFFARIGGVSNAELNRLELELLFLLDFGVGVSSRVFEFYCLHLEREMMFNGVGQKIERAIIPSALDDVTEISVDDTQSSSPPQIVDWPAHFCFFFLLVYKILNCSFLFASYYHVRWVLQAFNSVDLSH